MNLSQQPTRTTAIMDMQHTGNMTAPSIAGEIDDLFERDNMVNMFLQVAQKSFAGEYLGHLASYSYDESCPADNYVGGGQKWENFVNNTKKYHFVNNDRQLLTDYSVDMAREVVSYSDLKNDFHFFGIAPGSEFQNKDRKVLDAFNTVAQDRQVVFWTGVDINPDFVEEPKKIIGKEFPNIYLGGGGTHDIFDEPVTKAISNKRVEANARTSIVLYSGATVGNIATTSKSRGFPEKKLISNLQMLVDYSADESYLIVCHNAQTSKSVLENYSEDVHSEFALNSLFRIKRELPTTDFDPTAFAYDNFYEHETGLVAHIARSTRNQKFMIGDRSFSFDKGQVACRIGNSYQISNSRMGEICNTTGFIRLKSYRSEDGHTCYQLLKASDTLIEKLRRKYNYQKPTF